jgi:hypothetical protein
MGHDDMKMEMVQCLTTFGVNETYECVDVEESDGLVPDTFNDSTDDLKSGI